MKLINKLKRIARKPLVLATLAAATFGVGVWNVTPASTVAATTYDYNANAVIWGGTDGSGSAVANLNKKYDNGDGHNSAASIHHIYSWFNISGSDIHNMKNEPSGYQVVNGSVTSAGVVKDNHGTVIATDAITAGRQSDANFSCPAPGGPQTRRTVDGTVFYTRPPKSSFCTSPLSALVVEKNGVFQFAILNSCGNPVKATPKKPNYEVQKLVSKKGAGNFKDADNTAVTFPSGTHVEYKIIVKSTGDIAAQNIKVWDVLPKNVTEVANTLLRDGNAAKDVNFFTQGTDTSGKTFSGTGVQIDSLKPGDQVVFKFEAIVGNTKTPTDTACKAVDTNNVAHINAPGLPEKHNGALVNTTCTPPPVKQTLACTSLTDSANSRTQFSFTAKASTTNGAVISAYHYDFGDGTNKTNTASATSNNALHTYSTPGTYTVSVTVSGTVNGKAFTTPVSSACQVKVTVHPAPAAECTGLSAQTGADQFTYNAQATYTTSGGATLTGASFNWGDGTVTTGTIDATNKVVNAGPHTYAQNTASFTITATLTFSGTGVPASTCSTPVNINGPQPAESCDLFTISKGDNRTVTVTAFQTTAVNGATFTSADINWGDDSAVTSTATPVGQTHQYAADGSFTVSAVAHFSVNGQDVTQSGNCSQPVSFTTTPPQTPPTTLVNTGAGNVLGLFAAAVGLGTFGYHRLLRRQLSED